MNQSKFDITQKIELKTGMYEIHKNTDFNFQLNRLINMNLADVEAVREVAKDIVDTKTWADVLIAKGDSELAKGNRLNAMAFYRMAEFYMDWDDAKGLKAWKKARELFFEYYEDCFTGEYPMVEKYNVPYEGITMPVLKLNSDEDSKGDLVVHGGWDSSYEEFFPALMYLRQNGYTVYIFEGPGQGEVIRLQGMCFTLEWEKPVMAVTKYFDLQDVTLIGASFGGFLAPRASAFDERVTKCVSWAQFPSLKQNFNNNSFLAGTTVTLLNLFLFGFGWLIDLIYKLKKGKGMDFFKTYYHRTGMKNAYALRRFLWKVDLRPIADKLTKDYLIIGGSNDTMNSRASIGKQMYLLKNAKSITAREITMKEQGADHCNVGNQQVTMDTILLWLEGLRRRDETLQRLSV